jgi:sigma-B regulation protein RsbU (phosphoserine phosphatase)
MENANILIVDDTPANLSLLSQMLSSQGYRVRAANSGPRALESAHTLPPDLILLDIRMPGMNGFEVCEQLKTDSLTSDIPVIFISALNELQDKIHGFKVGGVDYITKPFQLEEVLVRTETHLSLRRLQKQLQDANAKMAKELSLAGKMQACFMPSRLPAVLGWQFSAVLRSARETSGDFFDIFQLSDGRIGLLIADVADKGVGAALFMAYCWSTIRTYAEEYPNRPEQVFSMVNRRILQDTATNEFVTVFYGVLNSQDGNLIYCNAGQNPPLLFQAGQNDNFLKLCRTGIPLGIYEDQEWGRVQVQVSPGDLLLLYTDGITEAQNIADESFSEARLLKTAREYLGQNVQQIQAALLAEIQRFVGDAQQSDDIALVVVSREE